MKKTTATPARPILVTLVVLMLCAGFLTVQVTSADVLDGASTPLNPDGKVYEIHPDEDGKLWISDLNAGELWRFDPAEDSFTIYQVDTPVSDAHQANGTAWWANYDDSFGSLKLETNEVSLWRAPGAQQLSATAITENGLLWLNDVEGQGLYRFDLLKQELCFYSLPNETSPSDYLLAEGGQVWLADRKGVRLLRMTPGLDELANLTVWELPADSYPEGLALDSQGYLWWADEGLGAVGFLNPSTAKLRIYSLQAGFTPEMIALAGDQVWFTEHSADLTVARLGLLDSALASYNETSTAATDLEPVTPECQVIEPESTKAISPVGQPAEWVVNNYLPLRVASGLIAYLLPEGGLPWGIATNGEQTWVALQGTQALLRLEQGQAEVFLPLLRK